MNPYLDLLSRNNAQTFEQALNAEQAGRFKFAAMMLDRAIELESARSKTNSQVALHSPQASKLPASLSRPFALRVTSGQLAARESRRAK